MVAKRKRQEFSETDKFVHKSSVLLQREAKKVRTFHVRKIVQQLKQLRDNLQKLSAEIDPKITEHEDAKKLERKQKQQKKLKLQIQKLEREHHLLKILNVKAVVARAMEKTGLARKQQQQEQSNSDSDGSDVDAHYGGLDDDDEGFNSEDYDNVAPASSTVDEQDEKEDKMDDLEATAVNTTDIKPLEGSNIDRKENTKASQSDAQVETMLIDRILAHKQIVPLLEAIEKVIEQQDREEKKKRRKQEKRALKRGRNEVLIGGRSAAPPSSLFLGSLSGTGADLNDEVEDGPSIGNAASGYMAGADDDIAEFLGEKKKKNRPGQMARRQKAMRQEEAAKRKQDRANGIFRPHSWKEGADSKYGRSERPKKAKKPTVDTRSKRKQSSTTPSSSFATTGHMEQRSVRSQHKSVTKTMAEKVEPSHPSWIAKQAQKAKEKIAINGFAGKKITFDE